MWFGLLTSLDDDVSAEVSQWYVFNLKDGGAARRLLEEIGDDVCKQYKDYDVQIWTPSEAETLLGEDLFSHIPEVPKPGKYLMFYDVNA